MKNYIYSPGFKKYIPLMGIISMGLLAASLGWFYLKSSEQATVAVLTKQAEVKSRSVVVPTQSLKAGTFIDPSMVSARPVPETFLNADALTPETFDNFVGQELTVDVAAGIPLLSAFFAPKRKVFSEQIEVGVRAITIPVDEISSISGLLRAGDRIDFMFIAEQKYDGEGGFIVPILQDVMVRATGRITAAEFAANRKRPGPSATDDPYAKQSFSTVTIAVQPKDAQKLILAQRMGKIIAALRNPEDRDTLTSGTNTTDLANLINTFRPPQSASSSAISNLSAVDKQLLAAADIEYIVGGAAAVAGNSGSNQNNISREMMSQLMAQRQAKTGISPMIPPQPSAKEQQEAVQQLYRKAVPQ